MYKISFKVRHKDCYETKLSLEFPNHHITVIDIQSVNPKEKHYFYYISGDPSKFNEIITQIKGSGGYKSVEEIERSGNTLLLLVVLLQESYIQNIIQKQNGFFLDLHTVSEGYEYWHIGAVKKESIKKMLKGLKKMGPLKILYFGEVDFSTTTLSKQQRKIFLYAHKKGYYKLPRETTISELANDLKLAPATVGEHLLRAENKLLSSSAKKL